MKLSAVRLTSARSRLAHGVEEIPHHLVGDQELEQHWIAKAGDDPEKRGSAGVAALACERAQRIFTDRPVGDEARSLAPNTQLASRVTQPPDDLASRARHQTGQLPGCDRGWVKCADCGARTPVSRRG